MFSHNGRLVGSGNYGLCACDKCPENWCAGRGPAAFEVTRDGCTMNVCSRCTLLGDAITLLIRKDEDLTPYLAWDPFQALVL